MVDLEKLVTEMKQRIDDAYANAAKQLEEASAQARAELEVMNTGPYVMDAAGLIVKDIRVLSELQPGGTKPVAMCASILAGGGYFGKGDEGYDGNDRIRLGDQVLPPGKYRVVVAFFKREG